MKDVVALIMLIAVMNLLGIAEACRARHWIRQAVAYYRVAFVCGVLGAIFF